MSLRLYKKEKLCSTIAIEALFSRTGRAEGALCWPLRAVWRPNPRRHSDAPVAFLISIPKKRLRHAVDRVTMRRRIREAYRLNHGQFPLPDGSRIDLAFIYVADRLTSYAECERAVVRLLTALQRSVQPHAD